jgi:hypothetical protein
MTISFVVLYLWTGTIIAIIGRMFFNISALGTLKLFAFWPVLVTKWTYLLIKGGWV